MPAVSKKQRRLAGITLAGKAKGGGMMGMKYEDLKHFASTPEKGLPMRKGKKSVKSGKY